MIEARGVGEDEMVIYELNAPHGDPMRGKINLWLS
jgi:hypothetical protein